MSDEEIEDITVCPMMRCSSCNVFPEVGSWPCAKHGIEMVPYSEMPLRKTIYRFIMSKTFGFKYTVGKLVKPKESQTDTTSLGDKQ